MINSRCFVLCPLILVFAAAPATAASRVFLMAGQSNMGGVGGGAELVGPLAQYSGTQSGVMIWDYSGQQWVPNSSSFGLCPSFGPEVSFGHEMHAAFPNDTIYLVKWSYGGSNLYQDWNPAKNGWCYNSFQNSALAALESLTDADLAPSIVGMLWMQGEADADDNTMAAAYEPNLTGLIAVARADFQTPEMPFVVGRITTFAGAPADNALVRAAQAAVPATAGHAAWIDTDNMERWPAGSGQEVHYNTQGQIDLGIAFADAILAIPEPSTGSLVLAAGAALACLFAAKAVGRL